MKMYQFRDPVHGFIMVKPLEKEIIDSYPFQRLRNIKQLAMSYYIYHGAEHTRFGHSIGVMYVATKAFRSVISKQTYVFDKDPQENIKRINWLEQILRLIALTHDLGHSPFSHAAENLFPLKSNGESKKKYYKHEDLTEKIIKETEIADIIGKIGKEFKTEYGPNYDITPEMICDIYSGKDAGTNSEFTFLRTLMDSELDCDKMDYLLRDSLYCGVSYGRYDIDRLISCLTIFQKHNDQTPYLGIESGGVQAFEEFVLARYFMFVQVYFHQTRRFFDITLTNALKGCLPNGSFPIDVREYLEWDDPKVIQLLKENCESSNDANSIVNRKHWKCIYSTKTHPAGDGLTLFQTIERTLKREVGKEIYNNHFIVDKSADKMPHKIVPRKHELDDEETIAIVNMKVNKFSTISDESEIINNLTEKINIQRIYVSEKYYEKASKIVKSLLANEENEEEEENDG